MSGVSRSVAVCVCALCGRDMPTPQALLLARSPDSAPARIAQAEFSWQSCSGHGNVADRSLQSDYSVPALDKMKFRYSHTLCLLGCLRKVGETEEI